jgi:hypothetical protein
MCNFIESGRGPWYTPGTFANAIEAARNFGLGAAMYQYAKSQNLRHAPQQGHYSAIAGALVVNRIYRAELWVGVPTSAPDTPNHEILIITGGTIYDISYFEPNFGFFQANEPPSNNRQAVEHCISSQYQELNLRSANFGYREVRGIV